MQVKISHWGNSLGIRIPKSLTELLNLHSGTDVKLEVKDEKLILYKDKEYDLESLVSQITVDNKPENVEWDSPKGREIW